MDEEPRIGRLLVASPRLADPNFSHTVVLILARDGDEGALGVVLNRPSTRALEEILASWAPLAADPAMVFVGGPVGHQGAIGLARGGSDLPGDGWVPIVGRLGTVDLARDPDDLPTNLDAVRVFSGHAGWGAGQLEAEIEAGAWVVLDAAPDDVLCADPDRLWRAVLRRQGGKLAWLANVPLDPRLN